MEEVSLEPGVKERRVIEDESGDIEDDDVRVRIPNCLTG